MVVDTNALIITFEGPEIGATSEMWIGVLEGTSVSMAFGIKGKDALW